MQYISYSSSWMFLTQFMLLLNIPLMEAPFRVYCFFVFLKKFKWANRRLLLSNDSASKVVRAESLCEQKKKGLYFCLFEIPYSNSSHLSDWCHSIVILHAVAVFSSSSFLIALFDEIHFIVLFFLHFSCFFLHFRCSKSYV